MKNSFFLLSIAGILFLTCNIDKKGHPSVQQIKNLSVIPAYNQDSIPDSIYEKIISLPFVQNRTSQLIKEQFTISFYNEKDTEYFLIEIVATDTFRMVPIFNFHYYPNSGRLFYLDTSADTLVSVN